MFGFGAPWAFLFQHSVVGLVVLAAVSAGVIAVLSGGRLGASLGGIFRIFITIFTTPFTFLSDALAMVRTAHDEEQDYAHSSVFMLYRANRIWYMALLVLALLVLSGGITTAAISVYPQAELEQSKYWADQIIQVDLEVAAAQQKVAAAGGPDNTQRLYNARQKAYSDYRAQLQSNQDFERAATFTGPSIDALLAANNAGATQQVRNNIDTYMSGCPRAWRNMTLEMCGQYRTFVLELANRRDREFVLSQAATDADVAWRNASGGSQQAQSALSSAQQRLENAKQQLAAVSPWDLERMGSRLMAALIMVLGTLWSVIVMVWVGAGIIDIFNWIVLMMRSLEKTHTQKLVAARRSATELAM
jgi:hypothetical protein